MLLYLILAITSNIMRIIYKSDIDCYNAGYYHSFEQSIYDQSRQILLNRIQINYEKKMLLDFILDSKNSNNDKVDIISPLSSTPQITKISNGGLYNDWLIW